MGELRINWRKPHAVEGVAADKVSEFVRHYSGKLVRLQYAQEGRGKVEGFSCESFRFSNDDNIRARYKKGWVKADDDMIRWSGAHLRCG